MEFKKIQLCKKSTLQVVYSNNDSDTITMVGANIVHKDLKEAFKELIPHLVLLTEQKEATEATLDSLIEQKDWEEKSIYTLMSVDSVSIKNQEISISGTRILDRGDVIKVDSPKIDMEMDEKYKYLGELSLALDNVKYEAEQYVTEKKWGLKEATLDFGEAGDPFAGKGADSVPVVSAEIVTGKKKKNKKKQLTA